MKQAVRIILFMLIIVCMYGIFLFSAQTGEQSNQMSYSVAQKISETGVVDEQTDTAYDSTFHTVMRKYAHFSMFFVLGALCTAFSLITYKKPSVRVLFPTMLCLLWAISDEIHQLYVPGRSGRVLDVMIDFSGSMLAMLCVTTAAAIRKKIKKRT